MSIPDQINHLADDVAEHNRKVGLMAQEIADLKRALRHEKEFTSALAEELQRVRFAFDDLLAMFSKIPQNVRSLPANGQKPPS